MINFKLSLTFVCFVVCFTQAMNPVKNYSGFKISPNSLRMIYYHDQTIAVVEVGKGKELLNCELIEIYNDEEGKSILKNLTKINKPLRITLQQMLNLMEQCDLLEPNTDINKSILKTRSPGENVDTTKVETSTQSSLYSGILPGTKWCGTGDLASTFFDLGPETKLDMCCRTHDLCPSKVRARARRYDVTNNSMYTKSHCMCDQMLYNCLKKSKNPTGDLMGSIYFNILRVPCVEEGKNGKMIFKLPPGY
ncbi:uncharacterized protein LOC126900908 [Daktulosphaira vitifoliae]|uniref:uncharacterized protein LOC126900908 n=1 Tax=Daktulosphaira vitifoliae TaxID=58002 RepID=UPI0021A9D481|nr:uncharacterized protein LOC126900908 [Daktulosphaira vitifoliae]